ncbi:MAG TPA: T9SS type A sorting domain-containing protein [Chitinophagales bacterium]|nr:T9SS type A sorting domain-containing protein [Chitinophagales bacterium]
MKPYFLLFLLFFLILVQKNSAQDFGAVGAKWYYSHEHFLDAGTDYTEVESIGDTTINNHLCHHLQIVHGTDCFYIDSNAFVYEENNIVYYFIEGLNNFSVMYDFNLTAGDTLTGYVYPFNQLDIFMINIIDVVPAIINGHQLKKFIVNNITLNWNFSQTQTDTIIEGIGSLGYVLPQFIMCDPVAHQLRCFEDSFLGFYSTNIAPSCDYISTGINDSYNTSSVNIFPNPANDYAEVQLPGVSIKNVSLKIFDVLGNEMNVPIKFTPQSVRIDLSALNAGMYLIDGSADNKIFTQKLLKQ